MRRLKELHFKKIIIIYSIILTFTILLFSLILIFAIKPPLPKDLSGSYLKGDDIVLVDNGVQVTISELQENLISASDLHDIFMKHFIKYIIIILISVIFVVSILSLIPCYFLNKRIQNPIDEIVKRLNYQVENSKDKPFTTIFPKEFNILENTFAYAMDKINLLYSDFNNLSTYVSHEQKNSLSLLRAKIQNGNTQDTIKLIDHMVKNLDDLLTICVHKNNGVKKADTDLSLICGNVVDEYKRIYPSIQFDFDEEQSLVVLGNEIWIYRAICNLLDNAIKYGNNTPIVVYVGVNYNCPFVSVTDGGIGIDSLQQEKIFTNGYRIGNINKNGYGIGLSLVKHVAELCNGFIWIDSTNGNGSTFKIVFPSQ